MEEVHAVCLRHFHRATMISYSREEATSRVMGYLIEGAKFLKLKRGKLRILTAALTFHGPYDKHLFNLSNTVSSLCRARVEETAAHILLQCSRVTDYRTKQFGKPWLLPEIFSQSKRMLRFLENLGLHQITAPITRKIDAKAQSCGSQYKSRLLHLVVKACWWRSIVSPYSYCFQWKFDIQCLPYTILDSDIYSVK